MDGSVWANTLIFLPLVRHKCHVAVGEEGLGCYF